jgi:thiamine phosphate synthase YjbQ (UPF0047 family)
VFTNVGEDADAHLKRQVMGREVVVAVTEGKGERRAIEEQHQQEEKLLQQRRKKEEKGEVQYYKK